jgi:hypothetical protein
MVRLVSRSHGPGRHIQRRDALAVARRPVALASAAALILVTVTVTAVAAEKALHRPSDRDAHSSGVAAPSPTAVAPTVAPTDATSDHTDDRWARVFERLNAERAKAWLHAKPGHLSRVFAAGTSALVADRQALRTYVERGLRVSGMHLVIGSVVELAAGQGWVRLLVVDRLGSVEVRDRSGHQRALPRDEATQHRVRLIREGQAGWRIASVRAA